MKRHRGAWLARSVEHVTLAVGLVSSSPVLGVEVTSKNKILKERKDTITLNCLFSSRSLCTSPCSLLHSSITFFTSLSSKEELRALDTAGVSVFDAVVGIILFISTSCCSEINESPSVTNYVIKDFFMQSKVVLSKHHTW